MPKFFFSPLWDCDENCLFCAKGKPPAGAKRRFTLRECLAIIGRKRREGYDELSLDGGEPTLLPYLPRLVSRALELGYREVMLLTNASPLADPEKARALAAAAAAHAGRRLGICVSLHSHKKAVSEALTASAGSFDRTLRGLRNLREAGLDFALYHLITSLNYTGLPAFAAFVLKKFPAVKGVTFSYIYPVSHNLGHMDALYPRLSAVQPYFARAVALLQAAGVRVTLSSCGLIPLCLMAGNERLFISAFMHDSRRGRILDSGKSELFPFFRELFNSRSKVKAAACRRCALNPVCGGIWNFYAGKYGSGELKPYSRDYFTGLPSRAGTVSIDPVPAGLYEDAAGADLVRLLEHRLNGWTRARFTGVKPGSSEAVRLRAFAAGIGYSRLDFS